MNEDVIALLTEIRDSMKSIEQSLKKLNDPQAEFLGNVARLERAVNNVASIGTITPEMAEMLLHRTSH